MNARDVAAGASVSGTGWPHATQPSGVNPKRPTIKQRAITYARRYPGQSATQIAHALRAKPTTVSAILYRAVQAGELARSVTRTPDGHGHWHVRDGGGPAGGHTYGPVIKERLIAERRNADGVVVERWTERA